jgi:hypothetical protein
MRLPGLCERVAVAEQLKVRDVVRLVNDSQEMIVLRVGQVLGTAVVWCEWTAGTQKVRGGYLADLLEKKVS